MAWFGDAVEACSRLLYYQGAFLDDAMRSERVTEREVRAAARSAGHRTLADVAAVVIEADGSLSVLPMPDDGAAPARPPLLTDVMDDLGSR